MNHRVALAIVLAVMILCVPAMAQDESLPYKKDDGVTLGTVVPEYDESGGSRRTYAAGNLINVAAYAPGAAASGFPGDMAIGPFGIDDDDDGEIDEVGADADGLDVLFVADLHVWRGLTIQTGPGVEFIDGKHGEEDEELFVYRVGALYEFETKRLTILPQLHLDVTKDAESLIAGVALGFRF